MVARRKKTPITPAENADADAGRERYQSARGGWGAPTNRNQTEHLTTATRVWPQYSNLFLQ